MLALEWLAIHVKIWKNKSPVEGSSFTTGAETNARNQFLLGCWKFGISKLERKLCNLSLIGSRGSKANGMKWYGCIN